MQDPKLGLIDAIEKNEFESVKKYLAILPQADKNLNANSSENAEIFKKVVKKNENFLNDTIFKLIEEGTYKCARDLLSFMGYSTYKGRIEKVKWIYSTPPYVFRFPTHEKKDKFIKEQEDAQNIVNKYKNFQGSEKSKTFHQLLPELQRQIEKKFVDLEANSLISSNSSPAPGK